MIDKDGGPAISTSGYIWITIRQHYKANAPETVKWDFEVVMTIKKPQLLDKKYGKFVNEKDIKIWEKEYKKQKRIQWPSVWADAMIAEDIEFEEKTKPYKGSHVIE